MDVIENIYLPAHSTSGSLNSERRSVVKNPTPQMIKLMVKNAVKSMKKTNGASVEDVCKYIESKYNVQVSQDHVNEALLNGVDIGTFKIINEQYFCEEKSSRRKNIENVGRVSPDPELEVTSMSDDSLNAERETVIKNTTPGMVNTMVTNAIQYLNKPTGASLEEICKWIEDNHTAVKVPKDCVHKALCESVDAGIFDKISAQYLIGNESSRKNMFVEERFKMSEENPEELEAKPSRRKNTENVNRKKTVENVGKRNKIENVGKVCPDPELKAASMPESLNPERETVIKHTISATVDTKVKNAIKYLKKPNGASLDEVCKWIEDNYTDVKVSKECVHKALCESVGAGIFEKINAQYLIENESSKRKMFVEERFKMFVEKSERHQKEAEVPIPTRDMIIMMIRYSIKKLNKANGASLKDISMYMGENYRLNMQLLELDVGHILNDMVNQGRLVKSNRAGKEERFKIKE